MKTNGLLVRLVGRHLRITDDRLNTVLLVVLLPVLPFRLLMYCSRRQNALFHWIGWGRPPPLRLPLLHLPAVFMRGTRLWHPTMDQTAAPRPRERHIL